MAHAAIGRADTYNVTSATETGRLKPSKSRDIDNVSISVHFKPLERRKNQIDNHTHLDQQKSHKKSVGVAK